MQPNYDYLPTDLQAGFGTAASGFEFKLGDLELRV